MIKLFGFLLGCVLVLPIALICATLLALSCAFKVFIVNILTVYSAYCSAVLAAWGKKEEGEQTFEGKRVH